MIQFDAVHKRFPNGTTAVHDLTLDMAEGGVTVLVGSSGCGKTTTLRMINRMVEPTSGTIRVGGKDVTRQDAAELRRSIGYVIQQAGLFPHRTVLDNIATVPLLLGHGRRKARARAAELLQTVGLTAEAGKRYPHQLSGGQQQRVGVARALAADPPQNGKLVVGAAPEVKKRQVGVVGLREVYGVEFKEFKSLDSSGPLVKGALKKGDVDVANLFTTAQLTELNRQVDKDKKDPEDVANAYAKQHGLA